MELELSAHFVLRFAYSSFGHTHKDQLANLPESSPFDDQYATGQHGQHDGSSQITPTTASHPAMYQPPHSSLQTPHSAISRAPQETPPFFREDSDTPQFNYGPGTGSGNLNMAPAASVLPVGSPPLKPVSPVAHPVDSYQPIAGLPHQGELNHGTE